MTAQLDALKVLGEVLITGFSGLELSPDTAEFLTRSSIGGVILFAHNYESPGQLAELTNQIQECRVDLPLWICTDHEGGKVQRFKKGFTRIPEAASVGMLNSPKLTFELAEIMAKELKAVGINVNFCPIADIATNPKNPVIGNRAFGSTEDLVSKMSSAMVRGHLTQGVQPCVKHFPGHGDTSTDSHFALPRVDTPLEVLQEREFLPFTKAIKSKCNMVMTAHIIAQKLDPLYPATLSKTILQKYLRDELRYERIIFSDDLEMKAITDHFGADEAPRLALEAGCDLLIYRTENAARVAYNSLKNTLESRRLDSEIVLKAAQKSRALKKNSLLPYKPLMVSDVGRALGTVESTALLQRIERLSR